MPKSNTRILIIGGGAAGLGLARKLARTKHHDVTLLDRNRTHFWKPLLHEVAAGALDPNLEEVGYGGHAARWGYRFFQGEPAHIDRTAQTITTRPLLDDDGEVILDAQTLGYDYLVLAFGGVSNDFGTPGVREHALFLEHRAQADQFRKKLLNECLRVNDRRQRGDGDATVDIAIVGGGATGVELSAELEQSARALSKYGLTRFDANALRLHLIEAGPRLLPALDEKLVQKVSDELTDLGVTLHLNTRVTEVRKDGVDTATDGFIPARMVLWAAGVRGEPDVPGLSDLDLTGLDKFVTEPTLQTVTDPRIFAIGDCAHCVLPGDDTPVPPRAQSAQQMADHVATAIPALAAGKPAPQFKYRDRGSLVSLSHFATVGSLMGNLIGGKLAIEGRVARLAYQSLYRMHILQVHGPIRGTVQIITSFFSRAFKPRLKLH